MSSRDIAELLETRHDSVKRTMERLFEAGLISFTPMVETSHDGAGSRPVEVYRVGKRDSYVVVARLSPEFTARLVDRWQELEAAQPVRLPTTAEAFASAFTMLAEQQRLQAVHDAAIKAIGTDVEQLKASVSVMSACPTAAEPMTRLRKRIRKMFGLSERIIDEVMRQSPYAPKPAGMVRNEHVDAEGSTYAVYWKKDVTATFERFATECKLVTASLYTHHFIKGRFKLSRAVE
jgi:phage regulator Rha-like protein